MAVPRLSPIAHAAFHDLTRSLGDEAVGALRGTPVRVVRGNRAFWYDAYRIGTEVKRAYIGEDTDALRARLAAAASTADDAAARQADRARLVRLLRAEGFIGVDGATGSLLSAFAKAGVFRLGGTIVGTLAFRLYEGILGVRLGLDQSAQTDDVDIASFERLSLALGDSVTERIEDVLGGFSFAPVPELEPGRTWRWRQTRSNLLVEFLTPSFEDDEGLRELKALGVHARALHHLNYLIAEPIPAAVTYRSGVLVSIPRPERFAVHKLIVADRRREGPDALKAAKDRAQAAFLIDVLAEDRPDDLAEALNDAQSRGPRWRERIAASLARMPATQARLATLG